MPRNNHRPGNTTNGNSNIAANAEAARQAITGLPQALSMLQVASSSSIPESSRTRRGGHRQHRRSVKGGRGKSGNVSGKGTKGHTANGTRPNVTKPDAPAANSNTATGPSDITTDVAHVESSTERPLVTVETDRAVKRQREQ